MKKVIEMLTEIRLELGVLCIIQILILICMVIIHMSRTSVQEITELMAKSSPNYNSFRDNIEFEAYCGVEILKYFCLFYHKDMQDKFSIYAKY